MLAEKDTLVQCPSDAVAVKDVGENLDQLFMITYHWRMLPDGNQDPTQIDHAGSVEMQRGNR